MSTRTKTDMQPQVDKAKKPHKYRATKTKVEGIEFDSKAEARRYKILKLMEQQGKISHLSLQPKYLLQESFRHEGKVVRAITYTADFRYVEDGKTIVEDVKGMKTALYQIKRKLFLRRYGADYTHRETK